VVQGNELKDGVFEVHILGNERSYVYRCVDRDIYRSTDSDVLEQDLQNLELLRGYDKVVRLVAAVVSNNTYQTNESDGDITPILCVYILPTEMICADSDTTNKLTALGTMAHIISSD
jgi:hypothetical protein